MFHITITSATKIVPSEGAIIGVINLIKGIFGDEAHIIVDEVTPTYDGKNAQAKEVGVMLRRHSQYPPIVST